MGHSSYDVVEKVLRSCNLPYEIKQDLSLCSSYAMAKIHKLSFFVSETVNNLPLELIHNDIWVLH